MWYTDNTCAEDRATLESDPSAAAGDSVTGQSPAGLCPTVTPSRHTVPKAINSFFFGDVLNLSKGRNADYLPSHSDYAFRPGLYRLSFQGAGAASSYIINLH